MVKNTIPNIKSGRITNWAQQSRENEGLLPIFYVLSCLWHGLWRGRRADLAENESRFLARFIRLLVIPLLSVPEIFLHSFFDPDSQQRQSLLDRPRG